MILSRTCGRAPKCAGDYQARISGPLFDRIDCHVEVPAVSAQDLSLPPPTEDSAAVAARIADASGAQAERYGKLANDNAGGYQTKGGFGEAGMQAVLRTNAEADGELLEKVAGPDQTGRALLTQAAEQLKLIRARLSSRAARGANLGRSRRRRCRPARACGGGVELSKVEFGK